MKKAKIIHLTSAHPRYDIRIFLKMCQSLANADYNVNLVVADGNGFEVKNNVKIYDVGKPLNRLERMFKCSLLVYKRALLLNGDIYHIHDPELLPYAYLLKLKGKKVIFDSHEDTPRQILSKPYLNKKILNIFSFFYEKIEKFICGRLDCIITATPFIRDIFLKYNSNSIDINNFPKLSKDNYKYSLVHRDKISYVGRITASRGCKEIVEAMQYVKNNITLCLGGLFDKSIDVNELKNTKGWTKTDYKGFLNQNELISLLNSSFAGIVTIYPIPNYTNSLPTKMFEYMRAGIPVIASDFPLWKEIIEKNHCGICVNPLDAKEIAKSIDYIYEHPEEALRMGENGRNVVNEKYNWDFEEKKLLNVYLELYNKTKK